MPATVEKPTTDAQWDAAIARYTNTLNDRPLKRCVEVARAGGARTLVVETRYLDMDYRSEFSAFYSKTFATSPGTAHRLHFFQAELDPGRLWDLPTDPGYLGYIVIRPTDTGAVARAMLRPPPALEGSVRTAVSETVQFFGQELLVQGVPFAQQDARLGACAHAAAWMCHHTAYLRGDVSRRASADFALMSDDSLHPARSIPTGGLTVEQLSDLFRAFDMPPIFYLIGQLPSPGLPWQPPNPTPTADPAGRWDHRIIATVCRHLNSGFPVLVGTYDHAFVLCGWSRSSGSWIEFVRHDDQQGPYIPVGDVLNDVYRPSDVSTPVEN